MKDKSSSRFADEPAHYDPPEFREGEVWIVGAGPGDLGFLTLYALYGLRNADIILYDSLISPAILAIAEHAQKEYVGKRAGAQTSLGQTSLGQKPPEQTSLGQESRQRKQKHISRKMIDYARKGKKVLRLKGGDPGIFGRGGEEAEALKQANIPFHIFAGVSAGLAAAFKASTVLTHRDSNQACAFATGHDANLVDWENLAKIQVIVIYMAQAKDLIAQALLKAGRAGNEEVALISHATMPQEQIIWTDLAHLGAINMPPAPTTIIIGAKKRW